MRVCMDSLTWHKRAAAAVFADYGLLPITPKQLEASDTQWEKGYTLWNVPLPVRVCQNACRRFSYSKGLI